MISVERAVNNDRKKKTREKYILIWQKILIAHNILYKYLYSHYLYESKWYCQACCLSPSLSNMAPTFCSMTGSVWVKLNNCMYLEIVNKKKVNKLWTSSVNK